ncbi:MAG: hypothetical protein ACRDSH_21035 [Pseudonocardiaceae bacterium]
MDGTDKVAERVASKLGRPGRDHLGYRVARNPRIEWITVLDQRLIGGLAKWFTVSGARLSRRHALGTGAATALLLLGAPVALTGCIPWSSDPERLDQLEAPARRAETDAAQATAVAQMATGMSDRAGVELAAAAKGLAADRTAHANALRAELRRVRPGAASTTSAPAPPPAAPPPMAPDLTSAQSALTGAMHSARDEAAALVMTLPGYRAALLASIAACCATHAALLA